LFKFGTENISQKAAMFFTASQCDAQIQSDFISGGNITTWWLGKKARI